MNNQPTIDWNLFQVVPVNWYVKLDSSRQQKKWKTSKLTIQHLNKWENLKEKKNCAVKIYSQFADQIILNYTKETIRICHDKRKTQENGEIIWCE